MVIEHGVHRNELTHFLTAHLKTGIDPNIYENAVFN